MDRNPAHTLFLFHHVNNNSKFIVYNNDLKKTFNQKDNYLKEEKFYKIQSDVQALINKRRGSSL